VAASDNYVQMPLRIVWRMRRRWLVRGAIVLSRSCPGEVSLAKKPYVTRELTLDMLNRKRTAQPRCGVSPSTLCTSAWAAARAR